MDLKVFDNFAVKPSSTKEGNQKKTDRVPKKTRIEIQGNHTTIQGETVEISPSEFLIRITDNQFLMPEFLASPDQCRAKIEKEFTYGMGIHFPCSNVSYNGSISPERDPKDVTIITCILDTEVDFDTFLKLKTNGNQTDGEGILPDQNPAQEQKPSASGSVQAPPSMGQRQEVYEVAVTGGGKGFKALALNLSDCSAQILITDKELRIPDGPGKSVFINKFITDHFIRGMTLHFMAGEIKIKADPVGVNQVSVKRKPCTVIECNFRQELTPEQLILITTASSNAGAAGGAQKTEQAAPTVEHAQAPPAQPQAQATPAQPQAQATPAQPQAQATPAQPQAQATPAQPQAQAIPAQPPAQPPTQATPAQPQAQAISTQLQAPAIPAQPPAQAIPAQQVPRRPAPVPPAEQAQQVSNNIPPATPKVSAQPEAQSPAPAPSVEPVQASAPAAAAALKTDIHKQMKKAAEKGATDLHIKAGRPMRARIAGEMVDFGSDVMTPEQTSAMAQDLMSRDQGASFRHEKDVQLSCFVEDAGRFRVSILRQQDSTALAIRCLQRNTPSVESLGLQSSAVKLAEKKHGLVLVTGPAGAGKSTTLAAMVDHINRTRSCHIITLERPVEYVHSDIKAQITQREIGRDALGYSKALISAMYQDPDVILVGNIVDTETFSLTLTAAESGRLVLASLNAFTPAQALARLFGQYHPDVQAEVRIRAADALQGVVIQQLVPAEGGGLTLEQTVLTMDKAVGAVIRENKLSQITDTMQKSAEEKAHSAQAGNSAQSAQAGMPTQNVQLPQNPPSMQPTPSAQTAGPPRTEPEGVTNFKR